MYQGLYNLVCRAGEAELFPVLRKHGISFYAYSPLGGSFLSGDISKNSDSQKYVFQSPQAYTLILQSGLIQMSLLVRGTDIFSLGTRFLR